MDAEPFNPTSQFVLLPHITTIEHHKEYVSYTLQLCGPTMQKTFDCKQGSLGRRAEMIIWPFTSTLKPTDYINRRRLKNQFETLQTFGIQNLLKNDVTSKGFVTQHFH